MPGLSASFVDFKFWNLSKVQSLFDRCLKIESGPLVTPYFSGETAALLFFEASTRTRMSFQTACFRIGLGPIILSNAGGTSLEKGESVEDSANVDDE